MSKIEEIRKIAFDVRNAMESVLANDEIHSSHKPYNNFPSGCCGAMSKILTSHFEKLGFENVGYMSGRHVVDGRGHAWIIIEGICVDITADQFEDSNYPPVMVLRENQYELKYIFKNDHPARRIGIESDSELKTIYELITNYLKVLN